MVLLERRYNHDSVAFVALLDCALARVTLPESLAVNQELILLAANVMPLLLVMELIVFAAPVLFLLLVGFLELDDATAMLLLLVGLELISAFAATLTLLLLELPLSVVPLLLLHGCEVNVRRRRQVVSWIRIFLRSFSHACHQLTVIVLCLTSLTVVARCMRV